MRLAGLESGDFPVFEQVSLTFQLADGLSEMYVHFHVAENLNIPGDVLLGLSYIITFYLFS